jgi:hypothetical protein
MHGHELEHLRPDDLAVIVAAQDADHQLATGHQQLSDATGALMRERNVGSRTLNERRVV